MIAKHVLPSSTDLIFLVITLSILYGYIFIIGYNISQKLCCYLFIIWWLFSEGGIKNCGFLGLVESASRGFLVVLNLMF